MTLLQRTFAAIGLALCALPAQAETLDLNLNDDAFRIGFNGPLERLFSGTTGEYQIGGLFSDDNADAETTTGYAGFLLTGDVGAPDANVTAGLGVRAQYTHVEKEDGGGAAVGGQVDVRFPGFERIGAQAYGYYQPEVLSLGEIEEQLEYGVSVDYQVLRNASIYVGYRELKIEPEDGGRFTADDGVHFGFRLNF